MADPNTTRPGSRFLPSRLVLSGLLAGVVMECIGGYWDVWWHVHQGRESFWTPPHAVLYSGAVALGIFAGIGGVRALGALRADLEALGRKFSLLMAFGVPPGYMVVVAGIVVQILSAPFDDAWHVRLAAEGKPDVFYTPPHLMATFGAVIAFGGVLAESVRCQKLALGAGYTAGGVREPGSFNLYDVAIFLSIGAMWLGLTFLFTPIDFPRGWVTLRGIAAQGAGFGVAAVLSARFLRFPGAFLLAGAPFLALHSLYRDGLLYIPAYLAGIAAFDLMAHQLTVRKYVSPVPIAALLSGLLLGAMILLTPLPTGPDVAWPEMASAAGLSLLDMFALESQGIAQLAVAVAACGGSSLVGAVATGAVVSRSGPVGSPVSQASAEKA